ncbi:alpha/beta hydrolase [Terriglobus sp. TAA 43]|uniref:alpha/beta hydrolase n=1 Tax=Terriglobus sp. TAA 43 TaxID=278961 RepID=UPI0006478C8E|nr:alpha/beta hydrolase [Terriglobus sp. TAA 43]
MLHNFYVKGAIRLLIPTISLALAGCSSNSGGGLPPVQAAGPTGVKNVLLVHGAWADGSSWNPVITNLNADGYSVTAVQLPLTSLADDVATVQRALARVTGKTLLVAHSYAGVVITQVGNDPKVAGLVYVAAYAPDNGESVMDLNGQVAATPIMNDLILDTNGYLTLTVSGIAADFAPDLSPEQQTTIAVTQGPVSAPNAFGVKVSQVAWKSLPSWYVVSSNDHVISPTLEMNMAKRMNATTTTLTSGHLAMLSHSADVTKVVETAATSLKP